ncbi:MAG: hypothetical protein LC789_08415 [Actinobacteria bacterium]|nr:hypothetical protein [Actinomycetota bacterium]MCA1720530.1 hypothetical protein [Actinomycetota bacterium]
MRKALALGTTVAALTGSLLAAAPAFAACGATATDVCTGTTTVAFTVDAGTIAIATTPAAASVTQGLTGAAGMITASLGLTTVTDTRVAGSGWVVSASSTDFSPVTGTAIPASAARYYVPAAPVAVLGAHTLSVGGSTTATAVAAGAALVTDVGSGVNTGTFLPSIKITLPVGTAALAYTGTVTQSVA